MLRSDFTSNKYQNKIVCCRFSIATQLTQGFIRLEFLIKSVRSRGIKFNSTEI
jgi:hypothetical protein